MPTSSSWERLVTRLVYRDAAATYGVLVLAVAFAAVWIERAWPPREIRAAIVGAEDWQRGLILGAIAAAYLIATRPVVRLLIASDRLAYLRHLPVSPRRWRRLHAAHLVAVNLPALGVMIYGLMDPGVFLYSERLIYGGAWASLIIAAQVDGVTATTAWRAWLGVVSASIAAAILGAGLGGSVEGLRPALGLLLAVGCAAHLWRRLGQAPPERDGRIRRGVLGLLVVRLGRRAMTRLRLDGPWLALLRLDLRALLRRGPQRARRRLWLQGAAIAVATSAIAAAARAGQPVDPWIVRAMLIFGSLVGADLLLLAHRLVDRDRWYLDALPISTRAQLGARLALGVLGAAPTLLGISLAQVVIGRAPLLSTILLAGLVGPLSAALMTWAGFRAEARRRLHTRALAGPAIAAVLAFSLLHMTDSPLVLAPLVLLAGFAASREVAPATRARRRLETSRRDDDHGASL